MYRDLANKMMALYQEMENATSSYQKWTGLNCLEGCGKCCLSPEVEASPLEMLPLSLHMIESGQAEFWLSRINHLDERISPCLLYLADANNDEKGRCTFYTYRPSLCRLFAVSRFSHKNGGVSLSVCREIKREKSESYETLLNNNSLSEEAPLLARWMMKLYDLDQNLYCERMPINKALRTMLERVLLYQQFSNDVVALQESVHYLGRAEENSNEWNNNQHSNNPPDMTA